MKRTGKCVVFTALVATILFFFGVIGESYVSAQLAGTSRSRNMQTFVLDSFEDPDGWRAAFSLFTIKRFNEQTRQFEVDPARSGITNFAAKPWGVTSESETNRCLAVRATFDRRGHNWIEVFPVARNADGRFVPRFLDMRGIVEAIDVWVWGGNFKYRLELHVIDFLGNRHTLDAGWLNYVGWRNLRINIPAHIPQAERHVPSLRPLRFEKFVILAHPGERPDNFHVYFDRMQIQTDVHLERFDGDDLVEAGLRTGWFNSDR